MIRRSARPIRMSFVEGVVLGKSHDDWITGLDYAAKTLTVLAVLFAALGWAYICHYYL